MHKLSQCIKLGSSMAENIGKELILDMREQFKGNEQMLESVTFKEDNDMSNSGDWYTTKLASAIYYKSYDRFQQYFDMVWNLTPADVGSLDGAGVYKIPKVVGAVAAKVEGGEVVDYINDGKDSVTLETETYAIGTRINRRLQKRAGKGIIDRLLTAASTAVLQAVCTDLINGAIDSADSGNTVAGEITYDKVEEAVANLKNAKNANGVLFGLLPDFIGFTATGWQKYITSTDIKAMVGYGQRNVPGKTLENDYTVIHSSLKVIDIALATATKGGKAVRALVCDSMNFMAFLKETELESYDGRLPGTPGDMEVIMAIDSGYVCLNTKGGSVITAA
jgi:hypothetical protein